MDFVIGLLISTDWKSDSYDTIFIIINYLTKMIYYKWVKIMMDVAGLAEIIIDIIVRHHSLLMSISNDRGLLFTSKL